MNKKKLIGAIIGVLAFVAIIAGATYAWITSNLAVNNGIYNVGTKNFVINFTKGNDISNGMPILASADASTAKNLSVKAGLATGSTQGTITIYLNITSIDNALLNDAIKYTYCKGTCSGTAFQDNTRSIGQFVYEGDALPIIEDDPVTSTTQTTYNIYFWLDSSKIGNDQVGASFAGYISAEATQSE